MDAIRRPRGSGEFMRLGCTTLLLVTLLSGWVPVVRAESVDGTSATTAGAPTPEQVCSLLILLADPPRCATGSRAPPPRPSPPARRPPQRRRPPPSARSWPTGSPSSGP